VPNLANILSLAAIKLIEKKVDELFDRAKIRYLGTAAMDKRIHVGFRSEFSLPGLFMAASREERVIPDTDIIAHLVRNAGNYLDAYRSQAKAQVVKQVQSFLHEATLSGVQTDLEKVLGGALADTWKKTSSDVRRMISTECNNARNMGALDGIVGVNTAEGIEDPVVYWVIVRDEHVCDECVSLHMLEDEVTPRCYYLSEVGHGYHKRGQPDPKVGGLHPNCRCTMVTLMPGYGFGSDGMVKFIKLDHDETARQRGLSKAEEPLEKGFKQNQIWAMMKPFGWQKLPEEGGHHQLGSSWGAKVPFQRGYSGDYDLRWTKHHLAQAGLVLNRRGKVEPDPGHSFYPHYVKAGLAQAIPEAPQVKSWEAPDASQVPIESVELGDAFDGKGHADAVGHMKAGNTNGLPALEVMDLGEGRYGTLSNHHLLQAAKDTGMTHVPVKLVKTEPARSRKPRHRGQRPT
jgi:hypothetical protein